MIFTYRDLARIKRRHWQPITEGNASLRWRFSTGDWVMHGPLGDKELPGGVDLETINQTWDRFAAVANGQV